MYQGSSLIHAYGWIIAFFILSLLCSVLQSAKTDAPIDFRLAGISKLDIF